VRSFIDLDSVIGTVPSSVVTVLSAVDIGRGTEALYRAPPSGAPVRVRTTTSTDAGS
jgi:hypothetical protein